MPLPLTQRMSVEEYLAFERKSQQRHEWIDGEVVAMSGGSPNHDEINTNLIYLLKERQRAGNPCRAFSGNMRVKVADSGLYTYPDVTIVCGDPQFEVEPVHTLLNPTLIVEILLPSTESYDRSEKWLRYRTLPSLREYLLIAQDRVLVERFVRQDDGRWIFSEVTDLAAVLRLDSIGCELALADIYRGVELEPSR